MIKLWPLVLLAVSLLGSVFCSADGPPEPVGEAEAARIKAELADRSFRQFEPHVDGDPRKGVLLDFFGGVTLWAQFAERNHAVSEWEITAGDYRIERTRDDGSKITIHFIDPRTSQQFPEACEGCIETAGVSISIRNVFDAGRIAFRLNDPEGRLPSPFPVFTSWTAFREDEIFD